MANSLPGTRKAALHFISNHHNTVLVAQAANSGNQLFWRNDRPRPAPVFEIIAATCFRFDVWLKQAFDGVEVLC